MKTRLTMAAALLVWAVPAAAQFGLRSAEGSTSLIQGGSDYTVLAVDTKDESLNLVHRTGVFGLRQEWFNQAKLSLSADGGDRDLFAGGRFVPGVRIQNRIAWSDFGADPGDGETDAPDGQPVAVSSGFTTLFGSLAYEMQSNSMAREGGVDGAELVLEDRTGHALALGAGINWARDVTGSWWGFSADLKYGWGVPVSSRTSEVCFTQSTAPSGGQPAVVSRCGSRYFGRVHDSRSAHLRMDWQSPYLPRITEPRIREATSAEEARAAAARAVVKQRGDEAAAATERHTAAAAALASAWRELAAGGSSPAQVRSVAAAQTAADAASAEMRAATSRLQAAQKALDAANGALKDRREEVAGRNTITILGSLSSDLVDGDRPRYNVAVGPTLHPGLKPLNAVGALLFELSDITDDAADWRDRFSVRLYLGVPFGGGGIR